MIPFNSAAKRGRCSSDILQGAAQLLNVAGVSNATPALCYRSIFVRIVCSTVLLVFSYKHRDIFKNDTETKLECVCHSTEAEN